MMRSTLVMSAASALQVEMKEDKGWPLYPTDHVLTEMVRPNRMYDQNESDRILKSKFEDSDYQAVQRAEFFNSIKDREFLDRYRKNNGLGNDTSSLRQEVEEKLDSNDEIDFHLYAKDSFYEKIKDTIRQGTRYSMDTDRMCFLTVRSQTFLVVSEIETYEHYSEMDKSIGHGRFQNVKVIKNNLLNSQQEKDSPDNLLTTINGALQLKHKMDVYDMFTELNTYKESNLYKYVDRLIFLAGQLSDYEERRYNAKIIRN